ncbi:Uncharacterised protein [Burkholderia pseudomallei]|nr:Uncharacterised protein [Burkholderia pseudomallei]CAJ4234629.1 Uncharacterised protein [Burkholderia pseudomallei]CAK0569144.1 Uncharacterised protein [Burkholderia pseudomallei]
MIRKVVDTSELEHWRALDAAFLLTVLCDYAKRDISFNPRANHESTRWHVTAGGREFEILCTGCKFYDTQSGKGGAGAIDLAMHLLRVDFKDTVRLLREQGV